jgi:hypothetical protein
MAKMSKRQLAKADRTAEKMKGKPGIKNPYALARHQVKQAAKKRTR